MFLEVSIGMSNVGVKVCFGVLVKGLNLLMLNSVLYFSLLA